MKNRAVHPMMVTGMVFLAISAVLLIAADDTGPVQGTVDRARDTLREFVLDPHLTWLRQNLDNARGVLIFPEVLKGGHIFGASGGTGVLLVRDDKTGEWSQPAFYTIGSVTSDRKIGGEPSQLVMLVMTQKAIDSLLSTSSKLGEETSVALGPVGIGFKASPDIPNVTGDFIAFTKTRGYYGGLNLEGPIVAVRDALNETYYAEDVRPADIVEKRAVRNTQSAELLETVKCKC